VRKSNLLVAAGAAVMTLLAGLPAASASVTAPFAWGGVTWCPSYHTYNGCNTVQSPPQYTVSFDPAQVSDSGLPASVNLTMNAAATASGAFNTWGNKTWTPSATWTEAINVPCNSAGKIENWPAFWTVGTVGSWPADGEIDIFEGLQGNATWTVHYLNAQGWSAAITATVPGNWCGTHTYSATWTTSAITFTWAGRQVGQVTAAQMGVPMFTDPQYAINDYGAGIYGGPTTGGAVMQVQNFWAS
jgi:hypothetical protein